MFEEYRLNLPSIRLNSKLYQRAEERTDLMIKQQAFDKVNEIKTSIQSRVEMLKKKSILLGSLSLGVNKNNNL